MSESLPPLPNLDWLKNRAKERLAQLRAADPTVKLAVALRDVARGYGYTSWRSLKAEIESRSIQTTADSPAPEPIPEAEKKLLDTFRAAIDRGDARALDRLLETEPLVRKNVNTPMYAFDGRPIGQARHQPGIVDVLLKHGADINLKSAWWAGGFGILDTADESTAAFLISRGAIVDIFAASHLNKLDRARELLDADPTLVNSKGGDGCRPLHFAASIEMIELLLSRGAEIDARDVDHESTPAQYLMPRSDQKLDLVRHLVGRGAAVDIFMAAALDDIARLSAILQSDSALVYSQVGGENIPLCPKALGDHIYIYKFSRGMTPFEVAARFGAKNVIALLTTRATPRQKFLTACSIGDRAAALSVLASEPDTMHSLSTADLSRLPLAAWNGQFEAVRLMLDLGFDPASTGPDAGGTVIHCAAWHGRDDMVEMILRHPAVCDRLPELMALKDSSFNATPIDWCCHGSTNCRAKNGNYVAVAMLLKAAGGVPIKNMNDATPRVRKALEFD